MAEAFGTDAPVDRPLDRGRLRQERPLPYLCVCRTHPDPASTADPASTPNATAALLRTESAVLELTGPPTADDLRTIKALIRERADRFGAFLVLEIWECAGADDAGAPHLVVHGPIESLPGAVSSLQRELREIRLPGTAFEVAATDDHRRQPPGAKPLLDLEEARRWEVLALGIELRPFYRDADSGQLFPGYFRAFRRQFARALRRAVFDFIRVQTTFEAPHFQTLATTQVDAQTWAVDAQLTEISEGFRYLFLVTPTNGERAFREFVDSDCECEPHFHYRILPIDPELELRRLYQIPIEDAGDPTLAELFRDKRTELARMIGMLADRGTPNFRYASEQIFGTVEPGLLAVAEGLLAAIPPASPRPDRPRVGAEAFAKTADEEFAFLRKQYPALEAEVHVRPDVSGILVSKGSLYIGERFELPADRVGALLQHEVGTHVLTYWNGRSQRLRQLYTGVAGYEALQEGLAVLAEWMVDGLTNARLRLLAARVVGVHLMVSGRTFAETFRVLHRGHGIAERQAFDLVMRVYRGGGLTKDAVYLRGLIELLTYLRAGGALEPLLIGKIRPDYLPYVEELIHRGILQAPPLRPRYMLDDAARFERKLDFVRAGATVFHLIDFRTA